MAKTKKIELKYIPVSGNPSDHEVDIVLSGSSFEEVARAVGIDIAKKDLYVNDVPARPDTHVKSGARLSVCERPAGS
jgi:hypothetical protein